MPMNFEIVTDSSCNLVEDMIDEFGLHILPLTFMVDGEQYQSYLKGQHTDLKQFYTMMRDGKVITTSLPNLADSEALMRGLLEQGRDVLYLGFSSGLSGTYEAVELLVKQLAAEFPERKLRSVDTLAASGGEGLLVWHAVQRARGGASIDEVRDWVEQHKLNLAHWFTVDDLMFLFRGGRVSKTAAWAGTMLNIKPVMHVDDEGRLIPLEKVRGRKKSLHALVDHMEKTAIAPIDQQMVFITHGDCLEDAEYVAQEVKERFGVKEVVINYVDPVIGAHSGPGTMALFFLAGVLLGQVLSGRVPDTTGDELRRYLEDYVRLGGEGAPTVQTALSALVIYFRYPLFAFLLGFASIGVVLLPCVTAAYGFFLSFSAC